MLLASCGSPGNPQPKITTAELSGAWNGSGGSVLTFNEDHSFSTQNLDLGLGLPASEGCGNITDTGEWEFLSVPGVSGPTPTTYDEGNLVALAFPDRFDGCDSEFTTWQVNGPLGLCLSLDPDSPCAGHVLVKAMPRLPAFRHRRR